jgi:hypothetical protein
MKLSTKVLLLALTSASCGKEVTYNRTKVPTPAGVDILCATASCNELGGNTLQTKKYVKLSFRLLPESHNQVMCSSVTLHGSLPSTSLGCNNAPIAPVVVTSKLKNPGDCQRLTLATTVPNPGPINVNKHPGHFQICEYNGPVITLNSDDLEGALDWNDNTLEVSALDGQTIEWKWSNNKLFVCLAD